MSERISITPKILDLNNSNDIYMTMNIVILSDDVNFNGAQFTQDFISGVVNNKDRYIGIPFLVNRQKIENGEFDNLTHEYDINSGELKTDQIGSFVDFWEEEVGGANCLMGTIRIFKRFKETCNAILQLFQEDKLETSCEVIIDKYLEVTEEGIRKIHYNDGKNALIGSAIVTSAAEYRAKPTLLIAEAYQKDIESVKKGGEKMSNKNKKYNNDIKVRYHETETASLKFHEIEKTIYNQLNPIDPKSGEREYNYYISDLYHDKVIVVDENKYDDLYAISYKVENNTVILDSQDNWVKGYRGFIPEDINLDTLLTEHQLKVAELQKQIDKAKEELEEMSKQKDSELQLSEERVKELETEVNNLQAKIEELNGVIVSEKEVKTALEETIAELNQQIEELKVYKENYEKAEKEAKMAELSERFSKLIPEDVFKSERVTKAIEELNETELNAIVVEQIAKEKEVEVASKEDVVVTSAAKQKDLLPEDVLSKYGLEK